MVAGWNQSFLVSSYIPAASRSGTDSASSPKATAGGFRVDGFLWFGADVEVGRSSNGGPQTSSNLLTFQETNGGAYDFSDTHWAQFIATNKERFMEVPELAYWRMILLQMVLVSFPMYKIGPSPRAIWNPMISIVSKFKSNLRLTHTCSDYMIIHI